MEEFRNVFIALGSPLTGNFPMQWFVSQKSPVLPARFGQLGGGGGVRVSL